MRELIFFLEEPSAKEMLNGLIPKLLDKSTKHRCFNFQGKQDFERRLERKLRDWRNPDARFVVLRDKDCEDCTEVKQRLTAVCRKAGKPHSLVRIVCHELESWFLGDLRAVEEGMNLQGLSKQQQNRKFRNPDKLGNAKQELKKLTNKNYQPISSSRKIGPCMSIDKNLSHSFNVFIAGVQRILNQEICS